MGDKIEERSSAEYGRATTATVSSLKSEDSTERLIAKSPAKRKPSTARSKSVEASVGSRGDVKTSSRLIVCLGLGQVVLGALLGGAGAAAILKGAALARIGAGLWAGCVAVVAGLVGLLAGINDCYGLNHSDGSSGLISAFLALSLICLACGNSAAVLAGTGLHRDYTRVPPPTDTFQDEMEAWAPVLANIAVLIIATAHCLLSIMTICHLSKRVCPCFRRKQAFDHNQFDPNKGPILPGPYVIHLDETKNSISKEKAKSHEIVKELEVKLQGDDGKGKKEEQTKFDSATSRVKLVTSWLGRHQNGSGAPPVPPGGPAVPLRGARGRVLKRPPPSMVLLPAHPASTLGRVPVNMVVPPRYATLPLPPYGPPAPIYYPIPDPRMRRRRSPRSGRADRRRRPVGRERDSQLTRSLERIHRKRRAERERERVSDAELKRTYTGLDRTYAEQFIAVCDESRSHAAERSDSLTSGETSEFAQAQVTHT